VHRRRGVRARLLKYGAVFTQVSFPYESLEPVRLFKPVLLALTSNGWTSSIQSTEWTRTHRRVRARRALTSPASRAWPPHPTNTPTINTAMLPPLRVLGLESPKRVRRPAASKGAPLPNARSRHGLMDGVLSLRVNLAITDIGHGITAIVHFSLVLSSTCSQESRASDRWEMYY
jgi:hypothetical protein